MTPYAYTLHGCRSVGGVRQPSDNGRFCRSVVISKDDADNDSRRE